MKLLRLCVFLTLTSTLAYGASHQGSGLSATELVTKKDSKQVMCMWNAYGKRDYICSSKSKSEAQKECDERATKARGEPSKCSCTDDPNFIKDMCD